MLRVAALGQGRHAGLTLALAAVAACASPAPPGEPALTQVTSASAARLPAAAPPAAAPARAAAPSPATAAPDDAGAAPALPAIDAGEAEDVLFPGEPAATLRRDCPDAADAARIRCLLARRYPADAEAQRVALDLYATTGGVAGVERAHEMDGGFRGRIRLVPEPPVGAHRKHLAWVAAASADFAWFFGELSTRAGGPVAYRHRPIAWRFFRSVGRSTPSAYAHSWTVAYNVSGSLLRSADATRETLFHEIFHLNDGERRWSRRALGAIYDGLLSRCGARTPCLAPYAPTTTMVRGGTYYAFQPDNGDGVHEYAAEIALRYYQDTRAVLRGEALARKPFRCGPPENAEAWKLVVDEFFGGVDVLPPC